MADKEIDDLTAADALTGTETVHVVQGGNSRRTTTQGIADLGGGAASLADLTDVDLTGVVDGDVLVYEASSGKFYAGSNVAGAGGYDEGIEFPLAPVTNDKFYRTDRNILYFYDGTRWLSTNIYSYVTEIHRSETNPHTGTTLIARTSNPFFSLFDIYVEKFIVSMTNSTATSSNYYTVVLQTQEGATITSLGAGISGQNDTQNDAVSKVETINTVVSSSVDILRNLITETGAASVFISSSITYRLVG